MLGRDTDSEPDRHAGYYSDSNSNAAHHTYAAAGHAHPHAAGSNPDAESNPCANAKSGPDSNSGSNPVAQCDASGAGPQPLDSDASSDGR